MPDIHIERTHDLGLAPARDIARQWADQARERFDMQCTYEEGAADDCLAFTRSGVSGTLRIDARAFTLDARLGFLLGAFKDRIEEEIGRNLDALLADRKPADAA